MGTDVTRAAGETAPRRVEGAARGVGEAGWRRVAVWVADYELALIFVPVGATVLTDQVAWRTMLGSLVVIPLTWLARWLARGRLTVRTPLDIPILGLVIMLPVSLYASVDFALSRVVLHQIIVGVALYYGVVNSLRSPALVGRVVGGLVAVGVALAVAAPVAVQWAESKLFTLPQIYGQFPLLSPLVNRNVLAGALAMIVPVVASLFLYGRFFNLTRRQRLSLRSGLGLILALMLVILFLTQSRGALIATAVGALALTSSRWRWLVLLSSGYGLTILTGIKHSGLASMADSIFNTDGVQGWAGRLEVWSRAVYMLQDFPYTGVGLGTFRRVAPVLYPFFLIGPDVEVAHAHNLFLQVGADLGLPGLVAFVAILSEAMVLAWLAFRRFDQGMLADLKALSLGLFSGLLAVTVHGLVDAPIWGTKVTLILWLMLGLSVGLYRLSLCLGDTTQCRNVGQE